MKTTQAPTGGGGQAKILRAYNQINNARRLILSLPKAYYETNEERIEDLNRRLKSIETEVEKLRAVNTLMDK